MRIKLLIGGLGLQLRVKGGNVGFGSGFPGDFGWADAQILDFEAAIVQKYKYRWGLGISGHEMRMQL